MRNNKTSKAEQVQCSEGKDMLLTRLLVWFELQSTNATHDHRNLPRSLNRNSTCETFPSHNLRCTVQDCEPRRTPSPRRSHIKDTLTILTRLKRLCRWLLRRLTALHFYRVWFLLNVAEEGRGRGQVLYQQRSYLGIDLRLKLKTSQCWLFPRSALSLTAQAWVINAEVSVQSGPNHCGAVKSARHALQTCRLRTCAREMQCPAVFGSCFWDSSLFMVFPSFTFKWDHFFK